jgi:DNA polymerase III subunit beta
MKIDFDRDQLAKALQRVGAVVEKKSTMPALGNVLLEAGGKSLTLTGTDLETTIQSTCPAKVVEEGRICVPARSLMDIVKELPEKTGRFSKGENDWMILESGKAHFRVVGMPPDKFPKQMEKEPFKFSKLRVETLRHGIERTYFAISSDEMRYNLNGAYLETRKDEKGRKGLRIVATDGHRLAVSESEFGDDEALQLKKGVILPRKGVLELRRLLTETPDKQLEVAFTDTHAAFQWPEVTVYMRLVAGDFPDYNAVVPKGNKKRLLVNRGMFSDSLRRVSLLSEGKSKCVRLGIKGNGVHLVAASPELGEAEEDVQGEFDGGEMQIGFNARYLLDVLGVIDAEKIMLELESETSPGVLRIPNDPSFFGVVMPMRV